MFYFSSFLFCWRCFVVVCCVFVFFPCSSLLVFVVIVMNLSLRKYFHAPKSAHSLNRLLAGSLASIGDISCGFCFSLSETASAIDSGIIVAAIGHYRNKTVSNRSIERQLHTAAAGRQKENERKSNGFERTWSIINRKQMNDERQRIWEVKKQQQHKHTRPIEREPVTTNRVKRNETRSEILSLLLARSHAPRNSSRNIRKKGKKHTHKSKKRATNIQYCVEINIRKAYMHATEERRRESEQHTHSSPLSMSSLSERFFKY